MKFIHDKEYERNKRIGVMPFRAHYIPFDIKDSFSFVHGIIDKTKSSRFISLNGDWLIKQHKNIDSLIDVDEEISNHIIVPSCVQNYGYDYYQYINHTYPIPYNPPFVPKNNPVFHYRKKIELFDVKEKLFLVFEGVDSSFYLYVNNTIIGYSQISHSKSEFDITPYIKKGSNVIDVVVLKWCASTYLEDQDKFRFTGIFRDVYLLRRPNAYIFDYKIESRQIGTEWFITVCNKSFIDFKCELNGIVKDVLKGQSVDFLISNPVLWNDEKPYLYDAILFSKEEKILERIGLRKIEIKNGIFLINGKHQKLKGINRHESSPRNGATVTIEETYKDLMLIKSIYANAIRTSHYPDIPEFYELCDSLGIYVVDEADVESHGATQKEYSLSLWQQFADSGLYDDAVFAREVSLYERDKNRTCVIIWSLGNESNYGKMFHDGADYIHTNDSRPIHYEGIWNMVDRKDYYTKRIDICSRMYPSVEEVKKQYLNDPKEKRPLLICEYTHSMGNSCGDVFDYWKTIMSSDRIIGAFVWEWCDHAVLLNNQFKYGSDFNEHQNDGNFCVDGLVTPDREFKSNTHEVKAVYKNINCLSEPELNFETMNEEPLCDNNPLKVAFDCDKGAISSIETCGKNILTTPIELCITRADIDNEMHDKKIIEETRKARLNILKYINETKKVTFEFEIEKKNKEKAIKGTIRYRVYNECIKMQLSYKIVGSIYIPRIGFKFSIDDDSQEVSYYGLGPLENYCDKHHYASIGNYSFLPLEQKGYLKPQEYGHRHYVSKMETKSIIVTANKPFSFNALPFSEEQLLKTAHDYKLERTGNLYINLDYFMSGVGSHSCGPELDEKYKVPAEGEIEFTIKLLNKGNKNG